MLRRRSITEGRGKSGGGSRRLQNICINVFYGLPTAGYPGYETEVNLTANVVNILMDYVHIRVFGMGVEGAPCYWSRSGK